MTDPRDSGRVLDRDLAPVASLIGDPTRIAILAALAEGHALPAGELAHRAGVQPATATAHLRQLVEGGLVSVRVQGRHRYHELAGPRVAAIVEALAQLAPPTPVRSLRTDRAARNLSEARTCYDHLAGRRGVELRDRLLAIDAVRMVDDRDHRLTERGRLLLDKLGIDAGELNTTRRVFARTCVDWTQRRPHLAGALPALLTRCFLDLGWVARASGRSLRVAHDYDQRLGAWLSESG
ncbi:MAG: ArsR/SmtB family transcription factor [Mycobacterium sp.]|jgi:DNA-binding transcriptional ArsR family regulator|uniref:ArsR/SmtB family transcription factor n=1 Tax=Mycobacterium sp. TaxID=1785 RepID=UPI00389A2886